MALLFDTGALANVIIERGSKALGLTKGNFALDLTGYETGNALWRLCCLDRKITQEEASAFLRAATDFLGLLEQITFADLDANQILELAISKRITFYDASYIVSAQTKRLTLVTDDEDLSTVANAYVMTQRSTEI